MKKLYRSTENKYVAGVLGGLGDYFNVDATLLRVIFLLVLIPSMFTASLIYLVAALIIPKDVEIY